MSPTISGSKPANATLFGGSGHAFVINIHEQLCPSGPYCWEVGSLDRLIRNLGIERTDHGFFSHQSPIGARSKLEATLRERMDEGSPCSLLNMENQLITGYDDTGFDTAQPWYPHNKDFPPRRLSSGTWT